MKHRFGTVKIFKILLCVALGLLVFSIGLVKIGGYFLPIYHSNYANGSITFNRGGVIYTEALTPEEISTVISILNGKTSSDKLNFAMGEYACGFSDSPSIRIGFTTYRLATDGCPVLQNAITGRHFSLTPEEQDTIQSVFQHAVDS